MVRAGTKRKPTARPTSAGLARTPVKPAARARPASAVTRKKGAKTVKHKETIAMNHSLRDSYSELEATVTPMINALSLPSSEGNHCLDTSTHTEAVGDDLPTFATPNLLDPNPNPRLRCGLV
jgi:hypothetical protein